MQPLRGADARSRRDAPVGRGVEMLRTTGKQKQIPCGNDNKKSKGKSKGKSKSKAKTRAKARAKADSLRE